MWELLAQAFWLVAPAYAANAFPPLVHGRHALDLGRKLGKQRLLGDGKTFEGTLAGIFFGMFIGFLQIISQGYIPTELGLGLATMTLPLITLLSTGAVVGDIAGAFIKRRLGIARGYPAFPLDQLDFLIAALVFAGFLTGINIYVIVILVVLTPIIHRIANMIGYFFKVKRTPW